MSVASKTRYKIAYLSEGHSVYDRRFLEKMVERGHKPYLISYAPVEVVQVPGVEMLHFDTSRILRFQHFVLLQLGWHLRCVLQRIKPDVLHTGYIQWHGVIGALSWFHPTLAMPWGSDILLRPDESFSMRQWTRLALKRAHMITCDAQIVKARIISIAGCRPEKVIIFPWGVDLSIFYPKPRPAAIRQWLGWQENPVLIMTRNFQPVYGIEFLIDALPEVLRACPETRVIFVGSGPLENDYKMRLDQLGLSGKVYFTGRVDDPTMAEFLNAADVYVTNSQSDGTSCSMLEAMACGLPVVVSDVPAYYEWVQDGINGFIVARRNVEQIATCLIKLIQDRDLQQEMGARNLAIARERADWEHNFDTLEGIYARLVGERRILF